MGITFKRTVATLLVMGMMLSNVVFAEGEHKTGKFTLEDAKKMAVHNSLELKTLQFNMDRIKVDRKEIEDGIVNFNYQMNSATNRAISLEQQINNLQKELDEATNPTAIKILEGQLEGAVAAYNALAGQSVGGSQLFQQMDLVNNGLAAMADAKEIQIPVIEYNVEVQYINLLTLDNQIKTVEKNAENLERLLRLERVKNSLGVSNDAQLETVFLNVNQVKNSLQMMNTQKNTAYVNFKKSIGYPMDQSLELENLVLEGIVYPNFVKDLNEVVNKGLSVKLQEEDIKRKERYIGDLRNTYDASSNTIAKERISLDEAKMKLEDIKLKVELNMKIAYNDLLVKREKLDLANKEVNLAQMNLNLDQARYDVGMISRIEFESKQTELELKQLAKELAEYEYIKAIAFYEFAKKGIV